MLITKYKIGQKFTLRRKNSKQKRTVVDIHITYNYNGDVVRVRYVTEHEFLGQRIQDQDVVSATIARELF